MISVYFIIVIMFLYFIVIIFYYYSTYRYIQFHNVSFFNIYSIVFLHILVVIMNMRQLGGIRCEKASAYMVQQGFENVYSLKGGNFFVNCIVLKQ